MKKKLLLLTILGTIISFVIYFYTRNDELTITALGDGVAQGMTSYNIEGYSYNDYLKEDYKIKHQLKNYYEFASQNLTIKELIYEIKENTPKYFSNSKIEIQRAINEADILTLGIGMDELVNTKINNNVRQEFKNDFTELLNLLKKLNKNKVIVLGLYSKGQIDLLNLAKINAIIRDITLSNNFIYIDISPLLNENHFLVNNNHYFNYEAHKLIYKNIKK